MTKKRFVKDSSGTVVYPVTSLDAVLGSDGTPASETLGALDETVETLDGVSGDKAYDAGVVGCGLGRKHLRKHVVGTEGSERNVLTQSMMSSANTIYHIQYDYDLDGASITVPAGCILKFDGGSMRNGTLVGNVTVIEGGNYQLFSNISFSGTWIGSLNAMWVGAKLRDPNFDNSFIIQDWFDSYHSYFKILDFPYGVYYFNSPCVLNSDNRYQIGRAHV